MARRLIYQVGTARVRQRRPLASFDSVVLAAIADEVAGLVGGRIVRVSQRASDEIALDLRGRGGTATVLCSIHPQWARVHLAPHSGTGPASPFCQMLRRRLDRAQLLAADQSPFERVLTLTFESLEGPVDLAVEIMGRHSNLVLVRDGVIAGSLKPVPHTKSSVRAVLSGLPYTSPPRDRPTPPELTLEALSALLTTSDAVAPRLATTILGISPVMARELAIRGGLDPDRASDVQVDAARRLWPHLQELIALVRERRFRPVLYRDGTEPVGYAPFPFVHVQGLRAQPVQRMSDAVAAVATHWSQELRLEEARAGLTAIVGAALAKVQRMAHDLRQALAEAEQAPQWKERGELLLAYASQVPAGAKEITLPGYTGATIVIPLEPALSAIENAQRIFKRYRKLRTVRGSLMAKLHLAEMDRTYIESVHTLVDQASTLEDLLAIRRELAAEGFVRARKAAERAASSSGPRSFRLASGRTVLVGRTNQENDRLTFRMAGPDDLWLHARGVPGAHVVLRVQGRPPTARDIHQAAGIAAYFSKARGSAAVGVDYTQRRYVRKPRGSKPGMVVYERARTVHVRPALPETSE